MTEQRPELVRNHGAEDERFAILVDSPRDGSIYTLEGGALVQYPKTIDGFWDAEGGGEVDWARGVEPAHLPYLREVERMLVAATGGGAS